MYSFIKIKSHKALDKVSRLCDPLPIKTCFNSDWVYIIPASVITEALKIKSVSLTKEIKNQSVFTPSFGNRNYRNDFRHVLTTLNLQ